MYIIIYIKFSIKRFNLYKLYLKGSMYKQHFGSIFGLSEAT